MKNLKNNFFKVFISCNLILLLVSGAWSANEARIVGGKPTTNAKVKYIVQIYKDGMFHCGGSALSQFYILTAAHCLEDTFPYQLLVVGGVSRRDEIGTSSTVSNWLVPEVFNTMTFDMDVSVLKLTTGLAGPSIGYATLSQDAWQPGDLLEVYGWGALGVNAASPNQIQTTTVTVMDKELCRQMYRNRMDLTPSMGCAYKEGSNSCHGDSGGPALIRGLLAGIVSWGIGCAQADSPAVYTAVNEVLPFIDYSIQWLEMH